MVLPVQFAQQVVLAVEDRMVRAVTFIHAEDVVIDIPVLHVDGAVRRIGDPVDTEPRAPFVHEGREIR